MCTPLLTFISFVSLLYIQKEVTVQGTDLIGSAFLF